MSNARREQTVAGTGDEPAAVTRWTVQARGVRRLPHRLAFAIADFSRPLWWSTVFVVPATLLAGAVLVDSRFGYGVATYSAALLLALSQTSERFADTMVRFDGDAGDVAATYRMGDPSLFAGDHEVGVSFDDVEAARFLTVADRTMVRLYHGRPFAEGTAFLVPPTVEGRLRGSLRRHDVSILEASEAAPRGWVRGRCVCTAVFLGAVPIGGLFVWPVYYSWAFLLVVGVHSIVLPLQGP